MALGVVFLLAALHQPQRVGARVYGGLILLAASAGLAVAGRHVWIQWQPPGSVPACGAPLEVLFNLLPLQEVVLKVFRGGGECQKIDWSFLGLSMPMWLVLVFLGLGVFGVWANFRRDPDGGRSN
jgi:disulfide bond formation protein DsbB